VVLARDDESPPTQVLGVTDVADNTCDPEWGGTEETKSWFKLASPSDLMFIQVRSEVAAAAAVPAHCADQLFDEDPLAGREFLGRVLVPRSLIHQAVTGSDPASPAAAFPSHI
jgi:hypothetical protein